MTAGRTEDWLSHASIAMATVARCHLAGCAAGSVAPGGARTDQ